MSQSDSRVKKKDDSHNGIRTLMETLKTLYAAESVTPRVFGVVDPCAMKFFIGA